MSDGRFLSHSTFTAPRSFVGVLAPQNIGSTLREGSRSSCEVSQAASFASRAAAGAESLSEVVGGAF